MWGYVCVTKAMADWCIQLCFKFHSHSYLPFLCLGLELNFKSRYFSQALFQYFFFVRDNAAPHESSGPLSVSFESGSNHQALDSHNPPPPPPLSGCVNIPWVVAPTLWINKYYWLENFLFNRRLDDWLKPAPSALYFPNWHFEKNLLKHVNQFATTLCAPSYR